MGKLKTAATLVCGLHSGFLQAVSGFARSPRVLPGGSREDTSASK